MNFYFLSLISEAVFEKAYCEYRLNRVESALKTIEGAPEQTDKLKELYGQVVRIFNQIKTSLDDLIWLFGWKDSDACGV